jgi:hypothetical protein
LKKHYHVISGFRGYMPDMNEVYTSKKAAQAGAIEWVRTIRDDGARVTGSAKDGWYDVHSEDVGKAGVEYIQITECWVDECLEDV